MCGSTGSGGGGGVCVHDVWWWWDSSECSLLMKALSFSLFPHRITVGNCFSFPDQTQLEQACGGSTVRGPGGLLGVRARLYRLRHSDGECLPSRPRHLQCALQRSRIDSVLIQQACGCSTVRGVSAASGTRVESACRSDRPRHLQCTLHQSRHQAPTDGASLRLLHSS